MRLALDGTVIRPPLTGVHYAVRHGLRALLAEWPEPAICLTLDPPVRAVAARHQAELPPLSPALAAVSRRVLWQQVTLPKLLLAHQADLLFAPAYTAPLRCPVPYILFVHDLIALRHPHLCSRLNALHLRLLMPASLRRADRILVSTEAVRTDLLALTGKAPHQVVTVPLGVDPMFLQTAPDHARPPELAGLSRYCLFVSTIEPKKGVDVLLAAWSTWARRHEVPLVLVGRPGWRCRHLLRQIQAGEREGYLRYLGYQPRALLPGLYSHATAVLVPSRQEGFGLPVLEAMAMGTPVLHTDHPVLCATAGGFGVPFAGENPASLIAALERLLAAPDLVVELQHKGRGWAASHTWQRWAEHFCSVANDLTPRAG